MFVVRFFPDDLKHLPGPVVTILIPFQINQRSFQLAWLGSPVDWISIPAPALD